MSMASRSTGFDERPKRRVWRRRLCACDRSDGRSTRPLPLRRPNHLDPTSSSTPAARSPRACATPDLQRKRSSSMDLAGGNHFLHCFRCQDPCWDGKAHS